MDCPGGGHATTGDRSPISSGARVGPPRDRVSPCTLPAMTKPRRGPAPTPRNQFSFSRLKAFDQCPLRYRYRYIKGMREAFRSVESHLGSAVHDVLEWLYESRRDGASPGLPETLERFATAWEERWDGQVAVVRVTETPESYLRAGREMLAGFFHQIFLHDRSTTIALEERLTVRLAPDVVFTGFADRIGRTEQGRLFVVDYKTSTRQGDGSDFSEGLQAPLYATVAMARHDAEECLAGYCYLRHGTTSWRSVTRDHGRTLQDRFLGLVRQAKAATEFPPRPGILCAWCGFNHLCPAARVPPDLAGGLEHARAGAAGQ